jgi:hypothetical protein
MGRTSAPAKGSRDAQTPRVLLTPGASPIWKAYRE